MQNNSWYATLKHVLIGDVNLNVGDDIEHDETGRYFVSGIFVGRKYPETEFISQIGLKGATEFLTISFDEVYSGEYRKVVGPVSDPSFDSPTEQPV
jgi:hypothetical protein